MIVSPDQQNQVDGSLQKNILAHLPELPVQIVPISWYPNFVFKEPPKGNYVLFDFMEPHSANEEYNKFWSFMIHNPPILTFRRETKRADVNATMRPIEWACYLPIPERATKESFMARPIDVLFNWGYSNVLRPKLHGAIFSEGMAKHGIEVMHKWDVTLRRSQPVWASIYTPHWDRKPMAEIIEVMQQAKITVSMPGNGQKTFRDTECVGTLMAIQKSDYAYSFPWDETNSIQMEPGNEFQSLLEATRRTDLYELYCACDANMRNYESLTYVNNYIVPTIQSVL